MMHLAFKKWQEINGLVMTNGNFAVVDRMALRETNNPRNLQRWQVFDSNQESWKTFRDKADAVADCMARNEWPSVGQFALGLKLVG